VNKIVIERSTPSGTVRIIELHLNTIHTTDQKGKELSDNFQFKTV